MPITQAAQGTARIRSGRNVLQTMERVEQVLVAHGLTIFARIDFSGDAERAGLPMRQEQMLIFGNPKAGTPLMQASPMAGLDLPLKALVWEDEQGITWIGYNTADYIIGRHGLPSAMTANVQGAAALLQMAAD